MAEAEATLNITFSKGPEMASGPITKDLSSMVNRDDLGGIAWSPLRYNDDLSVDAGHPAILAAVARKTTTAMFPTDGDVFAGGNMQDAALADVWSTFSDAQSPVSGVVEEVGRKTQTWDFKIKDFNGVSHPASAPRDLELSVDVGDTVTAGQSLVRGARLGKGNSFVIFPVHAIARRFMEKKMENSAPIRCRSLNGRFPLNSPQWSGGNPNFTCQACIGQEKAECQYRIILSFIGGPNVDTLYRFSLKGLDKHFWHDHLYKVVDIDKINTVALLMDTPLKNGIHQKSQNAWEWNVLSLLGHTKSPDFMKQRVDEARALCLTHYVNEIVKYAQPQAQMPQYIPAIQQQAAPQPASPIPQVPAGYTVCFTPEGSPYLVQAPPQQAPQPAAPQYGQQAPQPAAPQYGQQAPQPAAPQWQVAPPVKQPVPPTTFPDPDEGLDEPPF